MVRLPQFDNCSLWDSLNGVNVIRVSADIWFPSKFFLMERAGRRKLLLTGFICIAVCNLLTTITDSVLVGFTENPNRFLPPSPFELNVTIVCCYAVSGARTAQPAGPACFLPYLCL